MNDILEKDTLEFILKCREKGISEYKKYCEKLEIKDFTNIIYKEILEKLRKIEFDIKLLNNEIFEEEEIEMITAILSNTSIESSDIEKKYKDYFKGWFDREINDILDNIDKKDRMKIELQRIKLNLEKQYDIGEIEKEYEEFKLIRRSDYV